MLQTLGKREHLQVMTRLLDGPTTVDEVARAISASRLLVVRDLTTLYHAGLVRRSVDGARIQYELNGARVGHVVLTAISLARDPMRGSQKRG
jgi:DNA-binding transcriptional ArsR family regulator